MSSSYRWFIRISGLAAVLAMVVFINEARADEQKPDKADQQKQRLRSQLISDPAFATEIYALLIAPATPPQGASAPATKSSGQVAANVAQPTKEKEMQQSLLNLLSQEPNVDVSKAFAVLQSRSDQCANKKPVIHTIGWGPTFTFESALASRPKSAGERAVRISVEGYELDSKCTTIDVTIEGTVPVARKGDKRDYEIEWASATPVDALNIVLLEPFIDRLHTGDKVAIKVTASNRFAPADQPKTPDGSSVKSIARRVFVAYETEAFRKEVLRTRIRPDDINAFPLPEADVEALFGPRIARSYFVVRVSLRNTDTEAKLISTGMIRATGTAMIDPKDQISPRFSVPVSVVPHSLTQIYAVLTDEEVDQLRHRTFRGLEFIGALAAGAQGVFNFGAQAAKNVALFSGIIVPEGKKLWPDRYPGYQRNIVNYAMQDLVKVPANSVMDHKLLFFSKKELDGLVSDPSLFKPTTFGEKALGWVKDGDTRSQSKPDAFVIALAFDSLDIRFETVQGFAGLSSRDVLRDLVGALADLARDIDGYAAWTSQSQDSLKIGTYSQAESKALLSGLGEISSAVTTGLNQDDPKVVAIGHAKRLKGLAEGLKPADKDSALSKDLYGASANFGQARLGLVKTRVYELLQRVNSGTDAELMKDEIQSLRGVVDTSRSLLSFYEAVASALHEQAISIGKVKAAISSTETPAPLIQDFNAGVSALLLDLKSKQPSASTLQIQAP